MLELEDNSAVIETGGLGYEVTLPAYAVEPLSLMTGSEVTLHTYHYIQGGSMSTSSTPLLIGFPTRDDKEFFERFITVPGIGPKAAVKALARSTPEMARAIESEDVRALKSLPGIGDRTAREIIASLKGKVAVFLGVPGPLEPVAPVRGRKGPDTADAVADEAVLVLEQLGYRRSEAERMVAEVVKRVPGIGVVEEIVQQVYRLGIGGSR